jgi:hypothetical protein
MVDEISDFINSNTGGGAPSAKFKQLNDKVVGTITRRSIVTTKDQKTHVEVKNLVIEIDDVSGVEGGAPVEPGPRSIWVKPSQLLQALSNALKEAGTSAVTVGDRIAVEWYDEEPTNLSPKKIFRVAYKPLAGASASAALSVDDL